MDIIKLDGKGYASNTYVIISGSDSAVVDPSADISEIRHVTDNTTIKYILLTHGHFDHILTLDLLKKSTNAKLFIHIDDHNLPNDPYANASRVFGLDFSSSAQAESLSDGDTFRLGNENIKVISTPGHTPGSVCYDCGNTLICGDTLFKHGYGRYDLPGGDPHVLFSSLSMLAQRNDDPVIHPGHGASATLSSADIIKAIRNNNL